MRALLRYRKIVALCVGLALIVGRADGRTKGEDELRLLEFTNAASTSTCIGDPVTPLCAVETFEACLRRAEWPLCAEVDYEPGDLRQFAPSEYSKLGYYRYEVTSTRTVRAEFVPMPRDGESATKWLLGDVAVRLVWHYCPPIEKCVIETRDDPKRRYGEGCRTFKLCRKSPSPHTYVVRRVGHLWFMVADYDEHRHPDLQDDFWNRK